MSEVAPCYTFAMKHHFIYIVVIYIYVYCCYFNDQCVILLTQAVGNLYQQAMLEDWQMRLQKYCRANLSQSTWFDWLHRGIYQILWAHHLTGPNCIFVALWATSPGLLVTWKNCFIVVSPPSECISGQCGERVQVCIKECDEQDLFSKEAEIISTYCNSSLARKEQLAGPASLWCGG